jgi:hypothetical protein
MIKSKTTTRKFLIKKKSKTTKLMKFFEKLGIDQKGFNMFSALVAAVLLMTSIVLTNMLIDTEEKLGNEVYLMTNNFSLSDAATIARADALQTFNYNFRKQLEDFLTVDDTEDNVSFPIIKTDDLGTSNSWNKIKQNFEVAILKTGTVTHHADGSTTINQNFDAVIDKVAEETVRNFHDGRYGRYHVSISDHGRDAQTAMRDTMSRTIENSIGEVDFLSIVGCDGSECPIGTFYFIIPLDKMTNEDYESLPRIIVKDLVTGEELETPILPKTRLNIYIPLRFFKAVYETQKNALAMKDFERLVESGSGGTASLGYCDNASCAPRSNPLTRVTTDAWTNQCVVDASNDDVRQTLTPGFLTVPSYTMIRENLGANALTAFAKKKICDFGLNAYNADPDHDSDFYNYNYSEATGLPADGSKGIAVYPSCPFDIISTGTDYKPTKGIGTASTHLFCTSIIGIEASTLFIETNPQYIVTGNEKRYRIGVTSKPFDAIEGITNRCASTTGSSCAII